METVEIEGLLRIPNNRYADSNTVMPYKNRNIVLNKPVYVYKNLHKALYSIKQKGVVVAHAERLCLGEVEFIVNEKLRQKVLRDKQKNVHAYLKGFYETSGMGTCATRNDLSVAVYYNPYITKKFINKNYNTELKGAKFAILDKNGVRASYTF